MGYFTTTNQGFSIPDSATKVKDTRAAIEKSIKEIEKQVVLRFNSMSDMTSRVGTPTDGMLAWIKDVKQLLVYSSPNWLRVYPTATQIYNGTSLPSNSLGQDGDIYFRR